MITGSKRNKGLGQSLHKYVSSELCILDWGVIRHVRLSSRLFPVSWKVEISEGFRGVAEPHVLEVAPPALLVGVFSVDFGGGFLCSRDLPLL